MRKCLLTELVSSEISVRERLTGLPGCWAEPSGSSQCSRRGWCHQRRVPIWGPPSLSTFLTWRWAGNYGALVFSGGVSGRARQDPAWEHGAASLHPKMGGPVRSPSSSAHRAASHQPLLAKPCCVYIPPSTNKEKSLQPLRSTTLQPEKPREEDRKGFSAPPQCHGIHESPAPGPVLARWLFGDCSAPVIFSR